MVQLCCTEIKYVPSHVTVQSTLFQHSVTLLCKNVFMTSAPFNEKKRRFWIKYYIFRQSSFLRQSSRRLHASMLPPGNLFFQFNNSIAGNSDSLIIFERKSIQNLTISNGRLEASYFRLYYINLMKEPNVKLKRLGTIEREHSLQLEGSDEWGLS